VSKLASLVFFAIALNNGIAQNPECDLKRDDEGIKVYTCKTENEKFKLLRAEFDLKDVTLSQLKKFIWNVPNYTTWQYNMIESQRISSSGEFEMAYRSVVDAPWPVENRELVLNVRMVEDSATASFFIHSFDYDKPTPSKMIRVPFFDGSWKINKGVNVLKVTYTLRIDPGGLVPAWLANLAMAEGPFVSFQKLKKQLEKK
jgi:hypothetical protein